MARTASPPPAPASRRRSPGIRLAGVALVAGLIAGTYYWVPSPAGQRWVCGHHVPTVCTGTAPKPVHKPVPQRTPDRRP